MAMDTKNMTGIQMADAIKVCDKHMKDCKPSMRPKYERAKSVFENAQKKRENIIKNLKEAKVTDPTDPSKTISLYDSMFKDKDERLWSLAEIGTKLGTAGYSIESYDKSNVADEKIDASQIVIKHDFIDTTKDAMSDVLNGKGLAVGLVRGALGLGIVDLLTKGVTSLLVKNNIMGDSFGIVGLIKKGIEFAPTAWSGITTAASACWGFSQLATIAIPAALALAAVPMVKKGVDFLRNKYNLHKNMQQNFENEIIAPAKA